MITPINATKTGISPINKVIGSFYMLTEAGEYLAQEDGSLIILDLSSYFVSGVNKTKTAINPIGQLKS